MPFGTTFRSLSYGIGAVERLFITDRLLELRFYVVLHGTVCCSLRAFTLLIVVDWWSLIYDVVVLFDCRLLPSSCSVLLICSTLRENLRCMLCSIRCCYLSEKPIDYTEAGIVHYCFNMICRLPLKKEKFSACFR